MEDTMKSFENKTAKRRRRVSALARLEQQLVKQKEYRAADVKEGLPETTSYKHNITRIQAEISTLKGRI